MYVLGLNLNTWFQELLLLKDYYSLEEIIELYS